MEFTHTHNDWYIHAVYTGSKAAPWSGNVPNYNHNKITVKYLPSGKWTTFDFWQSLTHPYINTEYDIMNAFRCFIEDAISGTDSFGTFCDDYGYDPDSRKAYSTWKSCRRSAEKLERITNGKVDIYDLINSLDDYA